MKGTSPKLVRIIGLLRELFQLDQPDLDFGIYRILRARSGEVSQFLEKDLLPQVTAAFAHYRSADRAAIEKELAKAIEKARELGANAETLPKVQELRRQLAEEAVDVRALEEDVYDHLFTFFRRYYSEGDFLAKRVYKPGVYALPYEGEEVKLHWANADQYYIKTSEYLRDYAFRLRPDDAQKPMRVHFRLIEAAEGEHGNVKEAAGKERVFILCARDFAGVENDELVIHFEYRPALLADWPEDLRGAKQKPPAQKDLIALAARRIAAVTDPTLAPWLRELAAPHVKADGEQTEYRRLEVHLRQYAARNTFDYFIHKDLGGFLRRELDFYVKNEVMHLDDVENETAPRVEQYLFKIKVIRSIAGKIIDFLAQIENFQKKLWLKKKFVVETNYCVSLGHIPESLYPEIAANDGQREEWVRLFAVDEIKGDLTSPAYSAPLTVDFLRAHSTLVVDSKWFPADFTARLIAAMDDLNDQIDGLLVQSENGQALALLQRRYKETVKCIYIDPPYNSKTSEILYKNNYKHASWLSLIDGRTHLAKTYRQPDGVFVCAIDENEQERLGLLFAEAFPQDDRTCVTVVHNPRGIQGAGFSYTHEFAYFLHRPGLSLGLRELADAKSKPLMKTGSESERHTGRNCFYPIVVRDGRIEDFGDVPPDDWSPSSPVIARADGSVEVWPISTSDHLERKWRYARQSVESIRNQLEVRPGRNGAPVINLAKDYESYRTVWADAEFNAAEYGSTLLKNIVGDAAEFSFPKSIYTVLHSLRVSNVLPHDTVFDFFAGSGTTGHAVIKMNRDDHGRRKFIMVEMGGYFDTVLVPRIKKIIYAPEWKDGKPKELATSEDAERGPRIVKVMRLESYEDALNNLEMRRTGRQQTLLETPTAQGANGLRERYLLRYMLDVESRESPSLLDVKAFDDPTAYRLRVKRPGSEESREVNVDLIETFNYLIGLAAQRIGAPQTFGAEFQRDSEKRLRLRSGLRQDAAGPWWFRTVAGSMPDGQRALVIWRKLTGRPEEDNLVLNEWFAREGYPTRGDGFQLAFVNGDNNLESLRRPGDTWKVRLIEEDFHRLMFDSEGM